MLSQKDVIAAINKATEPFLLDGGNSFSLCQHTNNSLRLRLNNNISNAYNDYGNDGEQINVVKWFDDFWLFVEIQFLSPKGTIVSLSIFQGEDTDPQKKQLFRAEWDDYKDGSIAHPQPHWHFLTNKIIKNSVKEFSELLADERETFEEFIEEEASKIIDMSKFHFAMNGDWTGNRLHVHEIRDENILANWFGGLLGYLKSELEFMSKRRS